MAHAQCARPDTPACASINLYKSAWSLVAPTTSTAGMGDITGPVADVNLMVSQPGASGYVRAIRRRPLRTAMGSKRTRGACDSKTHLQCALLGA